MKAAFYQSLIARVRRTPRRERGFRLCCRLLPRLTAIIYGVLLIDAAFRLFTAGDVRLYRCIAVPAVTFVTVTLLRRWLNFPRPYEVYDLDPLLPPARNGYSFPSRHATSAAILALTGWYLHPVYGTVLTLTALGVTVCRVIAGKHFVRDVIAAWIWAGLCGTVGFWLL